MTYFAFSMLRLFSIQLKNLSRLKILPRFAWVYEQFKYHCAISESTAEKLGRKKSGKFSTFLMEFLSWNFNSQSDFVIILTFFNVASHNEATHEIYPGCSDCAIWNFLFQSFISLMGVHNSFLISNM